MVSAVMQRRQGAKPAAIYEDTKMADATQVAATFQVNQEQRFNVQIRMEAKTKDGQHFFSAQLDYSDLPYALLVVLEREAVGLADKLTQYGEQAVLAVKKA